MVEKVKNKGGRPSEYKESYCDFVIKEFANGASIEEICWMLKIAKETFYNWKEKYPKFLDSINKGVSLSEGWWKNQGRKQLENKNFNFTGWYMNMKNRFGWKDKHDITSNDKDIGVIQLPQRAFEETEEAEEA